MQRFGISRVDSVLSNLYAGFRVKLDFTTIRDRNNFRSNLYARKAQQDEAIASIINEPRKILRQELSSDSSGFHATYWLEPMKLPEFEILQEESKESQK